MTEAQTAQPVAFGVLGPLEAFTDRGPMALKGPRHRAVLARLLIARGRVVPVDRLVTDLWEVPSDGAVAAIRTFVSDLRRSLEPDRRARQPAQVLVTAPPGYALRSSTEAVDAWRFEAAVGEASRLLSAGEGAAALIRLDDALAMWRGPAYGEFAGEAWARGEINRLDELRMLAVQRRAEALIAVGRPADAAVDLEAYATGHPLREEAWHLLATALYRSGRQAEALAALRRARETLVADLGVDPGPRLRRLEVDILAQASHLAPPAPMPAPVPVAADTDDAVPQDRPFFGREEELATLHRLARQAARDARPGLALISGDAGAGKTALAEALTSVLAAGGWTTAWGRGPEYESAPVDWPWAPATDALVADVSDVAVARHQRHRAAVSYVASLAAQAPVLLVVDDLHQTDVGSLDLVAALVGEPEPVNGPVLILGTYRATEITPRLTAALARFARVEPVRVYLGGLTGPASAELARSVAGPAVDNATAELIHRRSGGNPFFIRELARLFAAEGAAAIDTVPVGVADVMRQRLTRLPDDTRTVLRQAAVMGRDVDAEVLAAVVGSESLVLDALDRAIEAGFLTESGPPHRLRFTHILVRDTLYGDLSALRRAHWHRAVAVALRRLRPDDVVALAHHFGAADSPACAPDAAHYASTAARQSERRSNPHEAARWWRQAVTGYDRAGGGDVRGRLEAVMGLGRALAITGHLDEARRHRAEAITAAERLGDPDLTASVITAFEVPAIWTRNDDEDLSSQIVAATERALAALPADRAEQRGRLLSVLALELRGTHTNRGHQAASQAEAIARDVGDPGLLAFALNARFMHTFHRTGLAVERARIGTELVDLASRRELVTFEVLGHLILLQAHCALGDVRAADADARAADVLAQRYDLPVVDVFTRWYAALRLAIDARVSEAEDAYRMAHRRLAGAGMPGMERGLLPLALLSLRLPSPAADIHSGHLNGDEDWGPYEPWVRPLILLSAGRRERAATALRALPESPHDLLREARLCLAARAALVLGEHSTMANLYDQLLPAAHELAGAGSGVFTLGPVAGYLGDLAAAQGRDDEAAVHYLQALKSAEEGR